MGNIYCKERQSAILRYRSLKRTVFLVTTIGLQYYMKRHKVEQSFGSALQSPRKNDPMVLTVHRCKFANYMPASVQCMALSPPSATPFLAVGKSDNSIELWNMSDRNDFFLERVIIYCVYLYV